MTADNLNTLQQIYRSLSTNLSSVIKGQDKSIRLLLSAFLTGGHVLLEDNPGTGKTTLAKALARSVDIAFQRIQFTPDLLPTDIIGVSIYNPQTQQFEVHRGPVFTDVLLADEINRASPRTQSALLESMAEKQISLDGQVYSLPEHFFVIATQNPIEFHGTYPLPEAQMDRFTLRLDLGYVDSAIELLIVEDEISGRPIDALQSVADAADISLFQQNVKQIEIADEIKRYVIDLVAATRLHPQVRLGASPRASIAIMKCAQALAIFDQAGFVTPDHIHELARPVLAHRLLIESNAEVTGANGINVVEDVLSSVPAPR